MDESILKAYKDAVKSERDLRDALRAILKECGPESNFDFSGDPTGAIERIAHFAYKAIHNETPTR